jgi:glycosyltransferase involved in cell wall biosynthesis
MPDAALAVELVQHGPSSPLTGIGRYTRELQRHLEPHVGARIVTQVNPPLTSLLTFLHYFPLGIAGHRRGSVVHFMEDVACSQMLWRPVRPAIATSHDLGMLVWPAEARMHRAFDRLMLRLGYRGLRRMDAVIAISEFSRRQLIDRLRIPADRVFAVHSGLDHELFRRQTVDRQALLARYGIVDRPDRSYLLYVGSELDRKNVPTLLRALSHLPESVHLLKVGLPGPPRFRTQTLRHIADLGLGSRVWFPEQVPEADLVAFYNAADVYVCASFLEGFGQPVLEAMACGLPVVCSDAASLPEITGPAAILVDPADDLAFAEAVRRVLDDPSRRSDMVARGLEQAARFSWDRTAAAVAAIYRRVATGAVAGPASATAGNGA